jgi:hypothetical protein
MYTPTKSTGPLTQFNWLSSPSISGRIKDTHQTASQATVSSSGYLDSSWPGRRGKVKKKYIIISVINNSLLTTHPGSFQITTGPPDPPISRHPLHPLRNNLRLPRHQSNQRPEYSKQYRSIRYPLPCRQMDTRDLVQSRDRPPYGR